MRFFRSFRLLHRRTKSESDIISAFTNPSTYDDRLDSYYGTRGHQYTTSKAAAASGTLRYHPLDIEFLPFDPEELYAKSKCIQLPTPSDHVTDVLEAKMSVSNRTTENLHDDVADLHWRMAKMRKALNAEMADKQYHRCQAELRAEHIMELEAEVSRHEAIQSILGRVGLSKDVLERALAEDDAGRNGEQVIASAGIQCNRVEDSNSGRTSHPSDQYNAALNMTLIVRREMRGMRKIGKFWKRMAQNGGQNLETITPSPSNISSICEPLSAERKKAVDDLIAKRRLSHLVHKNTHSNRTSPISTSTSSTSTILAPKAFENLSPLASESIKFELGQISNKTKIFNRGSGSSKKDALPTLASDVGVKGSIETLNVDAQLQTPEKQEVVANVSPGVVSIDEILLTLQHLGSSSNLPRQTLGIPPLTLILCQQKSTKSAIHWWFLREHLSLQFLLHFASLLSPNEPRHNDSNQSRWRRSIAGRIATMLFTARHSTTPPFAMSLVLAA